MEFGLLGPLFIHTKGVINAPSAPKLRTVLAMLLVHADQVVPVSSLIRELWDDVPPNSGVTTLQTYILNLRKLFASVTGFSTKEVSHNILITRAGGYLFQVGAGRLDIHRYYSLVEAGRHALTAGDDRAGIRHLYDALRLWRGSALMDVPTGRVLESKRRQFEESRLAVIEYKIDTELRLGMYRDVLAELAALIVENPLHEGLYMQYMKALYFSDRRAHALEVFHQLRDSLVTELGVNPGSPVQKLYQAILTSDVGFDRIPQTDHATMSGGQNPPRVRMVTAMDASALR
jgi:SARP family transcriptional regulator, regulator of embCAB operon